MPGAAGSAAQKQDKQRGPELVRDEQKRKRHRIRPTWRSKRGLRTEAAANGHLRTSFLLKNPTKNRGKKVQINERETVPSFSEGREQSGQRPGEEHRSLRWDSSASAWVSDGGTHLPANPGPTLGNGELVSGTSKSKEPFVFPSGTCSCAGSETARWILGVYSLCLL